MIRVLESPMETKEPCGCHSCVYGRSLRDLASRLPAADRDLVEDLHGRYARMLETASHFKEALDLANEKNSEILRKIADLERQVGAK